MVRFQLVLYLDTNIEGYAIGNLNSRVLESLRTSEIAYFDLSTSLGDEDGLNLDSQNLLHGTRIDMSA